MVFWCTCQCVWGMASNFIAVVKTKQKQPRYREIINLFTFVLVCACIPVMGKEFEWRRDWKREMVWWADFLCILYWADLISSSLWLMNHAFRLSTRRMNEGDWQTRKPEWRKLSSLKKRKKEPSSSWSRVWCVWESESKGEGDEIPLRIVTASHGSWTRAGPLVQSEKASFQAGKEAKDKANQRTDGILLLSCAFFFSLACNH